MKKIIIIGIVILLLASIVISQSGTTNEKPTLTKDLDQKAIEKQNKTKLMNTYGTQFEEVKEFNNYKQHKDITIINVTMKEGKTESYARIITNTSKYSFCFAKSYACMPMYWSLTGMLSACPCSAGCASGINSILF